MAADSPVQRKGSRTDRPGARKPLARRPKQLSQEPSLYAPAGGGSGLVLSRPAGAAGAPAKNTPGSTEPGLTDDQGELLETIPADAEVDPEVIRRARRIGALLAIPRAKRQRASRRGVGDLASVRYLGGSDEIDLDATLENLVEHPIPDEDDIVVREWVGTRRSVVLAVDVSGSMRGERARTAAATVGALFAELSRENLAVIAFWSDAALLVPLGVPTSPAAVLETLLRIPARGLTNVGFPLQIAAAQLAGVPPREARVVLLSDCVHNAGPDPREMAMRLPRLDVLLDTSGEHDLDLARDLARIGRGQLALAHRYRDVAPALTSLFAA